jgi:hypothetical protein
MFATIFRRNLNTVRLALRTFEQFGMIEIINDTVTIPNWEKHQQLDALEMAREATRKRVARHREKQKMLAAGNVSSNVTEPVTDDVTVTASNGYRIDKNRIDKNNILCDFSPGFIDFWTIYPRKVAKQTAVKAWGKTGANDSQALTDTIIADVKRRVDSEWKGKDVQYIPHPATYLNQRRWEDEVSATDTADDEYYPTYQEYHEGDEFIEPEGCAPGGGRR